MCARYVRRSQLYIPLLQTPKGTASGHDLTSRSHRLLLHGGYIEQCGQGLFQLLPLAVRVLEKITTVIDEELQSRGCQKIILSSLNEKSLWERTDRYDLIKGELFELKDRLQKDYLLAPTQEEAITHLVSRHSIRLGNVFPLRLYQTTQKYRDEMGPRFGLLRSREFIMKDLYAFDTSKKASEESYSLITDAYITIFKRLRLSTLRVLAAGGAIGGEMISHEFHLPSSAGQDYILYCGNCKDGVNEELVKKKDIVDESLLKCKNCNATLDRIRTIEVAHTFDLGQKYSKPFKATFTAEKTKNLLEMSCYGIGVTRLFAAMLEHLPNDNEFIKWPPIVAPFKICVIPPKKGSKEELGSAGGLSDFTINSLSSYFPFSPQDILVDDRTELTVGHRLIDCKRIGIPLILNIAKAAMEEIPKFEIIISLSDAKDTTTLFLTHCELTTFLESFCSEHFRH